MLQPSLTRCVALRAGDRPQRVCILGSTGSIGTSTLDVIALHPAASRSSR
jgi:hypothetical protein